MIDHDGVVQRVNEVACAILGFTEQGGAGPALRTPGDRAPHYHRCGRRSPIFSRIPEREHEPVELALYLPRARPLLHAAAHPLRARDRTHAGFILVLQDVTYLRTRRPAATAPWPRCRTSCGRRSRRLRMAVDLRADPPRSTPERTRLVEAAREDVGRLEDVAQRSSASRAPPPSIALRAAARASRRRHHALRTHLRAPGARNAASRWRRWCRDRSPHRGRPDEDLWALSNLIANGLRYTPRGQGHDRRQRRTESSGSACPIRGPSIPSSASDSSASCRGRMVASREPRASLIIGATSCRPTADASSSTRGREGEPLHPELPRR